MSILVHACYIAATLLLIIHVNKSTSFANLFALLKIFHANFSVHMNCLFLNFIYGLKSMVYVVPITNSDSANLLPDIQCVSLVNYYMFSLVVRSMRKGYRLHSNRFKRISPCSHSDQFQSVCPWVKKKYALSVQRFCCI